jgi:hypothetical protein
MRPGEIELLEIVVSGFEFAVVDRVNTAEEKIIVVLGHPACHEHAGRVRCRVPRRDVVSRVNAGEDGPLVAELYGGTDACLGIAIDGHSSVQASDADVARCAAAFRAIHAKELTSRYS